MVVLYLSVIVLLPLAAVVNQSFESGLDAFWDAVTAPQAVAALELTVICSLIVVVINADLRHDHRLDAGPRRIPRQGDRQLGDRPAFRMPTIVASLPC